MNATAAPASRRDRVVGRLLFVGWWSVMALLPIGHLTGLRNTVTTGVVVGTLELPQLRQLVSAARIVVCSDTDIAHLVRIIGVPTVALLEPGSRVVHGAGAFWANAPFRAVCLSSGVP